MRLLTSHGGELGTLSVTSRPHNLERQLFGTSNNRAAMSAGRIIGHVPGPLGRG